MDRSGCGKKLLHHDKPFKVSSFVTAILFGPRHPDPSAFAQFLAECDIKLAVAEMRREGTRAPFLVQELANIIAKQMQGLRQAERGEISIWK